MTRTAIRSAIRPGQGAPSLRPALAVMLLALTALAVAAPVRAAAGEVDPALLAGLEARAIGPAAMSGRVVALAGVSGSPRVLYVGAASGGLWRSDDDGLTWEPLFDEQPAASIGAITIDPGAPDVVWVGTGEPTPRNSASVGTGVYRSMDGGATWTHLGLDETERIARIVLDPRDTDTAYVCALGTTWGESPERGVFKTTDGGATWRKVLYGGDTTGCAELRMDPSNPNKLFASLWQHRRWPWSFDSGGPGSGLHVTYDGGATWTAITPEDGLPEPPLGRIGIAVAPSDPSRVYALVEAKENAFYTSTDGGKTFRKASTDDEIGNRPFYYSRIQADPADATRVYSSWSRVSVSEDAGVSWETLVPFNAAHPDHHALWVDPSDPDFVMDGNDGGVAISRDRGESWKFVRNLPLAQYYHVRVDDEVPYNVYGGLQDNGSWKGSSEVWVNGGIRSYHWQEVGFGDGFDTAPFPDDAMQGYSMSQEGYLSRWNLRTGERRDVRPAPPVSETGETETLRFNWNAALAQDPFDPATIYYGSQFVHRSTDRGESWEVISPDLTTDREEWQRQAESGGLTLDVTGAENFTTIIAIAPSPVERGVLWVGTDDGRLHVTRDGGASWTSLEDRLAGVPANTWIPHIHASHHDAGTAFVVLDDHRRSNWETYLYKTTDYGASWSRIRTEGVSGYALSVLEDPVEPRLLFLGTEFGLWVSLDAGASWFQWTHGVPTVSVMDMAIQEREGDLVLGTHGRGVFVLDDIGPLRELAAGRGPLAADAGPLSLFPIPDAIQHETGRAASSRFPGAGEFEGENAPYGALVSFYLEGDDLPHPDEATERERKATERAERMAAAETGEGEEMAAEEAGSGRGRGRGQGRRGGGPMATIEIRPSASDEAAGDEDEETEPIRTFEAPVTRGLNRVSWNLRHDPFDRPPTEDESPWQRGGGPEVLPGTYQVTVRFGTGEDAAEATGQVTVLADPRQDIPMAQRQAKMDAILQAGALRETLTGAIGRVHDAQADLGLIQEKLRKLEEDEEKGTGKGAEMAPEPEATAAGEEAVAEGDQKDEPLSAAAGKLAKRLGELEKSLWIPENDVKGIVADLTPWRDVSYALRSLGSSFDAPTPTQLRYLEIAEGSVERATAEVDRVFTDEVAPFRAKLDEAGVGLLSP